MMLNFCFFRNYCFFGELAFFSASERFLVLGRFGALGPPITVLTNIWNGVISRPKSVISRPKSAKINQVGRHSLAAKTPNMKRRYFWKRAKNISNSKKKPVSTSSDNFAQPEVPGIHIPGSPSRPFIQWSFRRQKKHYFSRDFIYDQQFQRTH